MRSEAANADLGRSCCPREVKL